MAKRKKVSRIRSKSKRKTKKEKFSPELGIKRKISLSLSNFLLFTVIAIVFYLLYVITNQKLLSNLFLFLTFVIGFVALSFLLSFLVFWIMKGMKK